jgi:hypothetical protein
MQQIDFNRLLEHNKAIIRAELSANAYNYGYLALYSNGYSETGFVDTYHELMAIVNDRKLIEFSAFSFDVRRNALVEVTF